VKRFSALAGLVLGCWSLPAFAQGTDEFGSYRGREEHQRFESGQSVAVELRFGPYPPAVDEEFNGATPFADTFGNDTRFLFGFEFDWQLLRIPGFGSLGPGFGWGFTTFSADAPLADGTGTSNQETSLSIMPMYVVGVMRVDVLAREANIPVVPYAKLGLGYALWWVSDGSDTARDRQGVSGEGSSLGWQYALGGMLLLDFFDPGAAIELDNTTGVNNSYFFAEWYVSKLGSFGGDQMHVGTNTWIIGLALEI